MTQLQLALLGPPLFELAGRKLVFATAKARALLVYLAVEHDRPHPRESLMTLFWDQSDDSSARTSLRQALAVLRDALGDADRVEPFLLVTREAVQLNPQAAVTVDVRAFREHIQRSTRPTGRPAVRVPFVAAERERALALYRGEFLAGAMPTDSAPFAEWAVVWRERLHQQALEAVVGLAQHRELVGDARGALRMWRRALALEPWREDAHQSIMRLLAASGDRSAALAHYAVARRVLAEELAIEPGRVLRDLRDAIEREDPAIAYTIAPVRAPESNGDLIGRESELEQLATWLLDPARRVITLHGAGGIGKTSLALAVAAHNAVLFPDGAVRVNLAAITEPALASDAILRALGVEADGAASLDVQLEIALKPQTVLLLLDNADHLLPELSERIAAWLGAAPGLTILATSRVRLGLQAEWLLSLNGLSHAGEGPGRPGDAAARLFILRAHRHSPDITLERDADAIGRLCRAVDGLPLALELAAALVTERTVDQIAAAVESQHSILAASWPDAPERHRSIAAVFEYSWRALDDDARFVLAHASVFRGGLDVAAIAFVTKLDADACRAQLAVLADRSLLNVEPDGRYELHELVRAFSAQKLTESRNWDEARRQHLRHFRAVCQRAADASPETTGAEHLTLRVELDNFRAALEWALRDPDPLAAGELATNFSIVFWRMGLMNESQTWLTRAAAALDDRPATSARDRVLARVLNEIGALASLQSNLAEADRQLGRALDLARQDDDPVFLARVLAHLARNDADSGNFERAESLMREALAAYEAGGSALGVARSYMTLGEIAQLSLASTQAEGYYREALQRVRALESQPDLAILLANLGMLMGELRRNDEGQRLLEESIDVARRIGHDYVIAAVQAPLAGLHVQVARQSTDDVERERHLTRARELTQAGIRDTHAQGIGLFRASGILQLAEIEAVQGCPDAAARLLGAAEMARGLSGSEWEVTHSALRDTLESELQLALGHVDFDAAVAQGRQWSLEETLARVLASNA